MSYILEALEKSEQERKHRAVPDLQTQPTVYPGITRSRMKRKSNASRRLRPAILLGTALVLSAWLLRDHLPVELEIRISRQAPQTISSSQDSVTPPSPQTKPDPHISPTDAPSVSTTQPIDNTQPEPQAQHKPAQAIISEPEIVTIAEPEKTTQDEIISPSSLPPATSVEKSIEDSARVRLQPAPIILTNANAPESISVAEPVPFLNELPAAQQQELPIMKFAGHTYSSVAGDRLIIINNGIKREGDAIGPGLKLEEITWDGVILNYRGLRFQVITTSQ